MMFAAQEPMENEDASAMAQRLPRRRRGQRECSWCRRPRCRQRCSACSPKVWYCDEYCQKAHWIQSHKQVCQRQVEVEEVNWHKPTDSVDRDDKPCSLLVAYDISSKHPHTIHRNENCFDTLFFGNNVPAKYISYLILHYIMYVPSIAGCKRDRTWCNNNVLTRKSCKQTWQNVMS